MTYFIEYLTLCFIHPIIRIFIKTTTQINNLKKGHKVWENLGMKEKAWMEFDIKPQ